jgi:hypothetical protein
MDGDDANNKRAVVAVVEYKNFMMTIVLWLQTVPCFLFLQGQARGFMSKGKGSARSVTDLKIFLCFSFLGIHVRLLRQLEASYRYVSTGTNVVFFLLGHSWEDAQAVIRSILPTYRMKNLM